MHTSTKDFFFGNIGSEGYKGMIDVEDFIFDESKNGGSLVIDKVLECITDVLVEFGEEHFGFLIG